MRSQMKENIADAFLAMLAQKSIDKISVKDLVEVCNISRQSFYYHFQDIMDVVEWVIQRTYQEIAACCLKADTLEDEIRVLVTCFVERYELLTRLRDSQKRELIDQQVVGAVQVYLQAGWRQVMSHMDIRGADAEALVSFYSAGITGLMMERCQEKNPDVDELARQIYHITQQLFPNCDQWQWPFRA